MALESATYISDLNTANPAAADSVAHGDDHLRLLKSTIKATFPNVTGAVTPTQVQFNYLASATGTTGTTTTNVVFSASPTFTGTVTAAAVTLSGLLTVNGQIKFPAAQSASADANTLDDYEEGTFTPTVAFGGGTTGITYSAQSGHYTKIGNTVRYRLQVTLSNKGSSTGTMTVEGLPFASGQLTSAGSTFVDQMSGLVGALQPFIASGATAISMRQSNAGTSATVTDTNASNITNIVLAGTYHV